VSAPNIEYVVGTADTGGIIQGRLAVNYYVDASVSPVFGAYAPIMGAPILEQGSIGVARDMVCYTAQGQVSTTDATGTELWSRLVKVGDLNSWLIKARVVARRTGGAAGTTQDSAAYERMAVIKNTAGTLSIVGSVGEVFTAEDNSNLNCTIDINGLYIRVMVTGDVNNDIDWIGHIELIDNV